MLDGTGRSAVVVGCGLGADAAYLAGLGFATTGFDVSPTAVQQARERHAGAGVDFEVGDLLDLPAAWRGAFDLVVEIFTVQALPDPPRSDAIAAVPGLVAPGGTLLAVEFRSDGSQPDDQGPPFPQDRDAMLGARRATCWRSSRWRSSRVRCGGWSAGVPSADLVEQPPNVLRRTDSERERIFGRLPRALRPKLVYVAWR